MARLARARQLRRLGNGAWGSTASAACEGCAPYVGARARARRARPTPRRRAALAQGPARAPVARDLRAAVLRALGVRRGPAHAARRRARRARAPPRRACRAPRRARRRTVTRARRRPRRSTRAASRAARGARRRGPGRVEPTGPRSRWRYLWDYVSPDWNCPDAERVGLSATAGSGCAAARARRAAARARARLARRPLASAASRRAAPCSSTTCATTSSRSSSPRAAQRCAVHRFDPSIGERPKAGAARCGARARPRARGAPELGRVGFHKVALAPASGRGDAAGLPWALASCCRTRSAASSARARRRSRCSSSTSRAPSGPCSSALLDELDDADAAAAAASAGRGREKAAARDAALHAARDRGARRRGPTCARTCSSSSGSRGAHLRVFSREVNLEPALRGAEPGCVDLALVDPRPRAPRRAADAAAEDARARSRRRHATDRARPRRRARRGALRDLLCRARARRAQLLARALASSRLTFSRRPPRARRRRLPRRH